MARVLHLLLKLKTMKNCFTILLILISIGAFSQSSGVAITPNGGSPDPSAGLDVNFSNKGFLMPRLTTSQRDAIQNPAPGLEIFNLTSSCLNIYTSNGWIEICSSTGCNPIGGTVTASRGSVSCNDTVTLTLSNYNGQITWYSSPDGNNWTQIDQGPDGSVFVATVTYSTTYFQAQVNDNNCQQTSTTVQVTAGGASLVGGTASSNITQLTSCSPTTIILSLTGNSNGIIQWQSSYDGVNFSNISGANSSTYTTSINSALYFQAQITDACSDPAAYSNIVSITSTASCSTVSFTAVGTTTWQAPAGVTSVSYLVVGGGGGGGGKRGGGGGGGGLLTGTLSVTPGNSYTVTVGAGGVGDPGDGNPGSSGSNSVFASITAIGGGGGGGVTGSAPNGNGLDGGSGGGGGSSDGRNATGGSGTSGQGYAGGSGNYGYGGGGGGGAGGVGQDIQCCGSGNGGTTGNGGNGGAGISSSISGALVTYAGGGGGGETNCCYPGGTASGGGGTGGGGSPSPSFNGSNGTDNTGGGGGGGGDGYNYTGGNGGSGIVIISY